MKKTIRRARIYQNTALLAKILKRLEVNPFSFLATSFFSFLASVFEGISIALLIPLVQGLFKGDFLFAEKIPVLNILLAWCFNIFGRKQSVVFSFILSLIFTAIILKHVLRYTSVLLMKSVSLKVLYNLRKKIYNRYLSFGKLFFDNTGSGNIYTVLIQFADQLSVALMLLNTVLYSVFSFLVFFIMMFLISWQVTIFTILLFPALHISITWLVKKIAKTSLDLSESQILLNKKIMNALSCIPLIKAYNNEDNEKKWFSQTSQRLNQYSFSLAKKTSLVGPIQEIVTVVMIFLIIGLMSYIMLKKNSGDIASFMAFFILLRRLSSSASIANTVRVALSAIRGPVRNIRNLYNDKDKFFIQDGYKEFKGLNREIELRKLSFSYPKGLEVLKEVNLCLNKNETTAIVGMSGGGKTTLINLLIRFYETNPGSIFIDGEDIRHFTIKSLRSKMALVTQDSFLFNASLRFNIIYGLNVKISDDEIMEAVKKARLYDFISQLPEGLDTEIGDRGVKLSGGEKQRVAILRAMLKNADIIMLDEATSSLDSITERFIQDAFDQLIQNKTAIIVAHRLSTVKKADKIVVLDNGSICEQGSIKDLLSRKGRFYSYWHAQNFFTNP